MRLNYNEYCMKFSNNELRECLISKMEKEKVDIRILSENGDVLDDNSDILIETIVFDGDKENLFVNFFGIHTSIFVFDKEIMFIDENSKGIYTSTDIYDNVVYEGKLREMSHEQMLKMFAEIIICFIDARDVQVIQLDVPVERKYKKYNYYDPHMFIINVDNDHVNKQSKTFENITINY